MSTLTKERILEIESYCVPPNHIIALEMDEVKELCKLAIKGLAAKGLEDALEKTSYSIDEIYTLVDTLESRRASNDAALEQYRKETNLNK